MAFDITSYAALIMMLSFMLSLLLGTLGRFVCPLPVEKKGNKDSEKHRHLGNRTRIRPGLGPADRDCLRRRRLRAAGTISGALPALLATVTSTVTVHSESESAG